jgi:predicted DNA-binding antitoxin AbrB/MazE fold protein
LTKLRLYDIFYVDRVANVEVKMVKKVHAIYDGKVLQPEEPVDLTPNTRVELTIKFVKNEKTKSISFLKTARSIKLVGPPDWATRFEEYLYGQL